MSALTSGTSGAFAAMDQPQAVRKTSAQRILVRTGFIFEESPKRRYAGALRVAIRALRRLSQRKGGGGVQGGAGEDSRTEARVSGGGDHGSVIRREGAAGETGGEAHARSAGFERGAELRIGSDPAGNNHAGSLKLFGGRKRARDEIADNGILKFANQAKHGRAAERQELVELAFAAFDGFFSGANLRGIFGMLANVVKNGGLQAAEAEVIWIAADFDAAEIHGRGSIAGGGREAIQNRSAGITEAEKLGDFVVGFAG